MRIRFVVGAIVSMIVGGGLIAWHVERNSRVEKQRNLRHLSALIALQQNLDDLKDVVKRRDAIDKFRSHFPYYSSVEAASLTDGELSTEKLLAEPMSSPISSEVAPDLRVVRSRIEPPKYQFFPRDGAAAVEIATDINLASPAIVIGDANTVRPIISIPKSVGPDGQEANYYFEVDTEPSFSSPNLWRYPALQQTVFDEDPTSISGLKFDVLRTTQRGEDGSQNHLRFPFRVTAMRLPDWDKLNFAEMQKQARALTFNFPSEKLVKEVFRYIRQNYPWSNDEIQRTPIDTFVRGVGECGHINDLMGTILEMNGIRYRGVAGFNPLVRTAYPGGGHSAIEILNSTTKQWTYVDAYLDLLLANTSAEEIARNENFERYVAFNVDGRFHGFGESVALNQLFRYRSYFDRLNRLPPATMGRLFGKESDYGMRWVLNEAPKFTGEELFDEKKIIYVRARYVFSEGRRIRSNSEKIPAGETHATASPWAHSQFEVSPRLLATGPAIVSQAPL